MAECNFVPSLHDIADTLQTLSNRLHNEETIRNGLDDVVSQTDKFAETFGRTLTENKEQLSIQSRLLEQARKPEEVSAEVLMEILNQIRTSFDSTRFGISEIQKKVDDLKEDCTAICKKTQSEIREDEIDLNVEKEDAADDDGRANELDEQAEDLVRKQGKKRKQEGSGDTWGTEKRTRRIPSGRANLKAVEAAVREADSFRGSANAKRSEAKRMTYDRILRKSNTDRPETELERIDELEHAIRTLEGVKKMLASSVKVFKDVSAAIQETETLLKETLLARSGSVTVLYARERRAVERKLENLKASWMRLQTAVENSGKKALHN